MMTPSLPRGLHVASMIVGTWGLVLVLPMSAGAQEVTYPGAACEPQWGGTSASPLYRDAVAYHGGEIEADSSIDVPVNCPMYVESGAYSIYVDVHVDDQHSGGVDVECSLEIYTATNLANGGTAARTVSDDSSAGSLLELDTTISAGEIPVLKCEIPRRYWTGSSYAYSAILSYSVDLVVP